MDIRRIGLRLKYSQKFKLFGLFLVACLLRFPRVDNMLGNDSFLVLFQSKIILSGYWSSFIHPLGIFGLFPSSGYPILGPAVLWIILKFQFSLIISITIFSLFWISIMIIGYDLLFKSFNIQGIPYLFGVLYVLSIPILLKFSYQTLSTRFVLSAILPFYISSLSNWLQTKEKKSIIYMSISGFFALIAHRISIIIILMSLLIIILELLNSITQSFLKVKLRTWKKNYVYLGLILPNLFGYIISTNIFKADSRKIVSPWFSNENFFGLTINIMIDYILRWNFLAIPFILIGYYVLLTFITSDKMSKHPFWIIYIYCLFLSPLLLVSHYTSILYIPFLGILFSLSIDRYLRIKPLFKQILNIIFIGISIGFILIYYIVMEKISKQVFMNYLIIFSILLVAPILLIFIKLLKTNLIDIDRKSAINKVNSVLLLITIISIMLSSEVILDSWTLTKDTYPYVEISDEELEIADFILSRGINGRFVTSNTLVSIRLAAETGFPHLNDIHGYTGIIVGEQTKDNVKSDCILKPINQWQDLYIYECDAIPNYMKVWQDFVWSEFNSTEFNQIVNRYNLDFYVKSKDNLYFRGYGTGISLLSETINTTILFETKNFEIRDL